MKSQGSNNIDSMKKRVDVPALLRSLYIEAKVNHRGEWWAICPSGNHVDRSPSWSIKDQPGSDKHGLHTCFGCHWGGGPIELVQAVVGLSYASARHWVENLSEHATPVVSVQWQVNAPKQSKFKLPAGVVQVPFAEWISPPKRYLMNRCIASQVDRYRLGYAVSGRCDGRVVIPVYNANGALVSYTARSYVNHEKRYLEPKEDERADKNAIFGEHLWNEPERIRGIVAITEGALNGLSVREVLPTLPIASLMGSDVTPIHIMKITNNFHTGLILTDPDYAGDLAAEKLQGSLARSMNLVRLTPPSGFEDWNAYLMGDRDGMAWLLSENIRRLMNVSC